MNEKIKLALAGFAVMGFGATQAAAADTIDYEQVPVGFEYSNQLDTDSGGNIVAIYSNDEGAKLAVSCTSAVHFFYNARLDSHAWRNEHMNKKLTLTTIDCQKALNPITPP